MVTIGGDKNFIKNCKYWHVSPHIIPKVMFHPLKNMFEIKNNYSTVYLVF